MGSPSSSRRHQFQNHLPGFIFICRKMIPALILLALQSATVFGSSTCNRTCGFQQVPFPFGFSSGCEIPLNCTESDETMRIGEFPVYNITSDTIMVNFPQNCLRPIEAMKPLFTDNFAPDFNTAILLRNCSSPDLKCSIPSTMVKGLKCEVGNMSCFSYPPLKPGFIKYENLTRTGCNLVFSAISTVTAAADDTMSVSLDVQVVKLAWWLSGDCRCSNNAQCYQIWSPGEPRYRCRCMEGFTGDGYLYGSGCLRGKKHHRYLIPTAAASAAGFAAFVILTFYFRRKYLSAYIRNLIRTNNTNDEQALENFLKTFGSLAPKRYSYSEVKKMTESFKNQLGQGGFGCVYKGKMHNGSPVAVKVLKDLKEDGEGFINEVASISRTSHVNIVSLNGFCFDGRKRALVYEFLSNGSLEKFIYENKSSTSRQLGWKVLYNIAIGIARGLEYLHRGCNTRILHFDIKPHNILLDENFCPKISDFGLAKLCVNKESTVSIIGARGTIGYIAPEVVCRSIRGISYKSDVYSYGMMVLEMVGGRKNVDVGVSRASEIYFPHWIHSRLELDEELELTGITNEEENEYARKMVIVSLWCIQMDPAIRPSMSKIVEMLEGNLSNLEIPPKPCFSSPSKSEVSYVRQSHNDTSPLTSDLA